MKALILAAGYGTRLYPVIIDRPKALLPVNDRPLIDYLLDKIENCAQLTEVLVVTNEKFHDDFRQWAEKCTATFDKPIRVINDGTTTPDDRLGAMGDVDFAIQKQAIAEDLLVMGGDNLFDFSLDKYLSFAQQKCPHATIGLYDIGNIEQAKSFGVVALDAQHKVISFEEKPTAPQSTLISMCVYYIPKNCLGRISEHLAQVDRSDTTGGYIRWLASREPVYGCAFQGKWYDIGTIEAYHAAQKEFKSL